MARVTAVTRQPDSAVVDPARRLSGAIERGLELTGQPRGIRVSGGYFVADGPVVRFDAVALALAGRFGREALDFVAEELDDGRDHYTRERISSPEQVAERITRAVAGGLPVLARRVDDYPALEAAFLKLTRFRVRRTSTGHNGFEIVHQPTVFRVVTYLTDTESMRPAEVAGFLKENGQ